MTSWNDLREDFQREVFSQGIAKIAEAIPADRSTVYRLLKGETERPSNAIKAGVERVVRERREQ